MRDVSLLEFFRMLAGGIAQHPDAVLAGLTEAVGAVQREARDRLGEDHIETAIEISGLGGVAAIGFRDAEAGDEAVAQELLGAAGAGLAEDVAGKLAGEVVRELFRRQG
jgi:hypothetical protein